MSGGNFYWKNRLNKGNNKNNFNSQNNNVNAKSTNVRSVNTNDHPVLVELNNLDHVNKKPAFINYTGSKNKELESNFQTETKTYNMIKKLCDEVKDIKESIHNLEYNIAEIKDALATISVGDVLHDGDLKIKSEVRTDQSLLSTLCDNDDLCLSINNMVEEDIGLDHKGTFVPVLSGGCRHPENLASINNNELKLKIFFNVEDLDEYIIYPFGEDPSPISVEDLKDKLYLNLDDNHQYIFSVQVDEDTVISWRLEGFVLNGEVVNMDIDMSKVNYLLLEESLNFLYLNND